MCWSTSSRRSLQRKPQGQRNVYSQSGHRQSRVVGSTDQRFAAGGLLISNRSNAWIPNGEGGARFSGQYGASAGSRSTRIPKYFWQVRLNLFFAALSGSPDHGAHLRKMNGLKQLKRHFPSARPTLGRRTGPGPTTTRTTGVSTPYRQVPTETTLLTLIHVGQGLQGTLVGAVKMAAATNRPVVPASAQPRSCKQWPAFRAVRTMNTGAEQVPAVRLPNVLRLSHRRYRSFQRIEVEAPPSQAYQRTQIPLAKSTGNTVITIHFACFGTVEAPINLKSAGQLS